MGARPGDRHRSGGLLAVASRDPSVPVLVTAVVPTDRCGAAPDSHRIPSCLARRDAERTIRVREHMLGFGSGQATRCRVYTFSGQRTPRAGPRALDMNAVEGTFLGNLEYRNMRGLGLDGTDVAVENH